MESLQRKMEVKNVLNFIDRPVTLFCKGFAFTPSDIDFTKWSSYNSKANPLLLSREAYLRREEFKEDLIKLDAIIKASCLNEERRTFHVKIPNSSHSWFLPSRISINEEGIKVPSAERYIILDNKTICLFPGQIKENTYHSYSLEEALSYLDKKTTYISENPFIDLNFTSSIDLDQLKERLIKYMRDRTRILLKKNQDDPRVKLYQLIKDQTPFEESLVNIRDRNINRGDLDILSEFPLIYTDLSGEYLFYIEEESSIIEEATKYFPKASPKDLVIINPISVSTHKSDKYNIPVLIDIRALHINYAFEIKETNQEYEDFLNEPCWISAPIFLTKIEGSLHGKIEAPPYFFQDALSNSN